jgi:hypothetical protein
VRIERDPMQKTGDSVRQVDKFLSDIQVNGPKIRSKTKKKTIA